MWIPIHEYIEEQNRDLTDGKYRYWIMPKYPDYAIDTNGVVYKVGLKTTDTYPFIDWDNTPMKPYINNDGYVMIHLRDRKKDVCVQVAKLMVQTFKENPNGWEQCDHINRDMSDNRLDNLRHATPQMNVLNRCCAASHSFVHKNGSRYQVQITMNGKQRYYGIYQTLEAACKRRDEVCKQYGITYYRH